MEETILVIDDSPAVTKMFETVLQSNGYGVLTEGTGMDGIRAVEENHPDLILLDVVLPDIDGWEVCKLLKKNRKTRDIPVIMQTGAMTKTEHELKSFDYGADDYIVKPSDINIVLARIKAVINRTNYKKELSKILNFGMMKIVGMVVTVVGIIALFFALTFHFIIKTAQLGRYAKEQLIDVFQRMNMLFAVEGIFLVLVIGLIVYMFSYVINGRLRRLERLMTETGNKPANDSEQD